MVGECELRQHLVLGNALCRQDCDIAHSALRPEVNYSHFQKHKEEQGCRSQYGPIPTKLSQQREDCHFSFYFFVFPQY